MTPVIPLYLCFTSVRLCPYAGVGAHMLFSTSTTVTRAQWHNCLQSCGKRSLSMPPSSLANWRSESTTRSVVLRFTILHSLSRGHKSPDTTSFMSPERSTHTLFHTYIVPFSLIAPFRGSASKTVSPSTRGGWAISPTLLLIPP